MILRSMCLAVTLFSVTVSVAGDWPQFRGPNRDGVSTETGLLKEWPEDGPPLAWKITGLGGGYSTVSVTGERIYTLGNKEGKSSVIALNKKDGKLVWTAEVGRAGGNLGSTPTVVKDRIYAIGQEGDVVCIDAKGKRLWHRNVIKDFGGVVGDWRYCESLLVDGNQVIITPGGKDATMVALAADTGKTIWECPIPVRHPQAGYSSVVITKIGDVKMYVQLINGGLVGVSTDGRFLWSYEKLGPNTANIPTPIVLEDYVYCSAGYGKGGALLKLEANGKNVTAKELYFNKELTNKHGGVIRIGDHLYGDSDDSGRPFCADFKTGKVLWVRDSGNGKGSGSAAVTAADGMLYFHYQDGYAALVKASPEGYEETGSIRIPKTNGSSWAHPVVSGGHLYLREGDMLYCYDVRKK